MEEKPLFGNYNERLFKSGFRKKLHEARFRWMAKNIIAFRIPQKRVFELGCFDAKTIDFLPSKPDLFVGYDANWENALILAKEKWKEHPEYIFYESTNPSEIKETENSFDLAISMETLEHVNANLEELYIDILYRVTNDYIIITIPNEIGLLFLLKRIYKYLFQKRYMLKYTLKEVIYTTFSKTKKVERDEHKGYNYNETIGLLKQRFDVVKVQGVQFGYLPLFLNFTVGIVGRKKL